MRKKFTRRQIVSSLGISGLGVIGLNRLSRPSLAANTDWTGNNVSQEVSGGTISDVTIPQSNLSFEVAYRGLDPDNPLTVRIDARLQTEESAGSDEFDEVGAGIIQINSADGTVTESDLSLDGYSFPLGIVSNHTNINQSDFEIGDADSKTTTVEIQVVFEQGNSTESITTAFDVTLSESTSFDVSKLSYTGTSLDLTTEDLVPRGIVFNNDGTKLFMTGTYDNKVYSYDLSTAYDISKATYREETLDVSGEDTAMKSIRFNGDGTKLFMIGDDNNNVYEYNLSTAYDINTARYTTSFDISSEDTQPFGIAFKSDGAKMFMVGMSNEMMYEYDLSTANDISTASYTGKSLTLRTEDPAPFGIVFNNDGTKLFMIGNGNDNVYEYDLSTAYDISTASYSGKTLDVSSQETRPFEVVFNGDGTKLFIIGSNYKMYEYSN